MTRERRQRWLSWGATQLVLIAVSACNQGEKPGSLVGNYAVHGVLVENSCGQSGLPTGSPLDFAVEIRTNAGVAYWIPTKSSQNSGTLSDSGKFRFAMSDTQVVQTTTPMRQLEPSDFLSADPERSTAQQNRACALTRKQTVQGKLARRLLDGAVDETTADRDAEVDSSDDLNADHVIEVTPTSGSDCNGALAALGGAFLALPCEARYVLNGSLDTSMAVVKETQVDAGP